MKVPIGKLLLKIGKRSGRWCVTGVERCGKATGGARQRRSGSGEWTDLTGLFIKNAHFMMTRRGLVPKLAEVRET